MMTKEELKKNAEKSLDKRLGTYAYIRRDDCYINYVDGYIDGAAPREKQIAEAKELLKRCIEHYIYLEPLRSEIEQFLKEVNN